MLVHLSIKNYALIQHLELSPSKNLSIVTGETGAGKSIMLGAIGLLLGNRADTKTLHNESEKCIIEGEFDVSRYALKDFFEAEDLDYEKQSIIRREIAPSGKSRAFINDTPTTLDVLKRLGLYLMDIHSQHDTLLLGSNNYQLKLIDDLAGHHDLLKQYQQGFKRFTAVKKELSSLEAEAAQLRKESDYNQFLFDELSKADLSENEQQELEEQLKVLEHAEEIKTNLTEAFNLISDGEYSSLNSLNDANRSLKQISNLSEKYKELQDRLESSLIELGDIAQELERDNESVEYDPVKTEETKERLGLIYQLQQKHQVDDIKSLLAIQQELEGKVSKVLNLDEDLEALRAQLSESEDNLLKHGKQLSKSRQAIFPKVKKSIEKLLSTLGMPDASIEIINKEIAPHTLGIDEVSLLFSANKGVKPQPLKNVASGGEFSRLMFCVKYVLADKTSLPTIIFDEIDTGVSGEIALKLGALMKKMADNHQVIAISHLPQVAAKGDVHYFVYKDNSSNKAISRVRPLEAQERVTEIAKMIGGDKPSQSAYDSAKELMA
ncbi:MAG: DNA repair protein RecN [Bacteroidota bacterium]